MLTLNSPQVVQETVMRWKREHRIALVPTMGCLHEGHLALVRRAKEFGQKTVVSLFVNPLQFGPNEDFEKYPRTLADDASKLEALDVDLLFNPSVAELYPEGFATKVSVPKLAEFLCGRSRPGHFDGVATVVLKLFNITQPDFAVFGQKDFQQLRLLQQLTADLNLPVTILPHPTVREPDGLALSSRNRYLSASERTWAHRIPEALDRARESAAENPSATVGDILAIVTHTLGLSPLTVDYAEIASELTLSPSPAGTVLATVPRPRLFVAAKAGATRLIDNTALHNESTGALG